MSKDTSIKSPKRFLTNKNYAQKTAELYDQIAGWYARSFWNDEIDSDWITLCLSAVEGKKTIADIGSGPGNYSRIFVDAGYDVTCTDISFEMIREAASRLPAIYGIVSDMRHMPFGGGRFDCVFCAYSINHIFKEHLRSTLYEFARILRLNGVFCLLLKIGSSTYEFSSTSHPSSHGIMCLFNPKEMLDSIQAVGIQPTIIRYKSEASKSEFQHEKMLIIGSKPTRLVTNK